MISVAELNRLRERIAELEAENERLLGRGWQPIETAPKDGATVLVEGGIAYWRTEGWFTLTAVDWPGRKLDWEPTHWMPLPEPPKE